MMKGKMIRDEIMRYVIVVALMVPVALVFHESILLNIMAIVYVFGLWLLIRREGKEDNKGNP